MTTLEVSNLSRYGFMGGHAGANLNLQMGHWHQDMRSGSIDTGGDVSPKEGLVGEVAPPVGHGCGRGHHKVSVCAGCGGGFLMHLLGLDHFTTGKTMNGLARASMVTNPFDLGVVGNCKDFWTVGHELGVEYERLYEIPLEGFHEVRRQREEGDDMSIGGGPGWKGLQQKLLMGLRLGVGHASRGGYEPISQV
jgi:hypothetical protein